MDAPGAFINPLAREVAAGDADCWGLFNRDNERIGMMVTRVREAEGRELEIVAVYAAPASDGGWLPDVVTLVDDLAKAEGCESISFHTSRPALAQVMAQKYGYRLAGMIMRKAAQG